MANSHGWSLLQPSTERLALHSGKWQEQTPATASCHLAFLHIIAFLYLNQLPDVVKLFSDSIVLYIFVIYLHY